MKDKTNEVEALEALEVFGDVQMKYGNYRPFGKKTADEMWKLYDTIKQSLLQATEDKKKVKLYFYLDKHKDQEDFTREDDIKLYELKKELSSDED